MKEIEFSRWLFELPAKQHSQFSPSGSTFLPCLSLLSKSHHGNSISYKFLESPHQVDLKNVVKSSENFFGYFNTLETQCTVCVALHKTAHKLVSTSTAKQALRAYCSNIYTVQAGQHGSQHKCIMCSKVFMHAENLRIHIQSHLGAKAQLRSCQRCRK